MTDIDVALVLHDGTRLDCRSLAGEEMLGVGPRFTATVFTDVPLESALLRSRALVVVRSEWGERLIPAVVSSVAAAMTASAEKGRVYRIELRSGLALLELCRRTRVYQHLSVPAIVRKALEAGGYGSKDIVERFAEPHAPREYVTQYDETDAAFIRRICEDEGIYFRFVEEDGRERVVLEDTSAHGPLAAEGRLQVVGRHGAEVSDLLAWDCDDARRTCAGRVVLRDYDHRKPALKLEGIATGGTEGEKQLEVYEAPGGFSAPDEGNRRARLALQARRAEATTVRFRTNAVAVAPGTTVDLECAPDYVGAARPEGKHFVVGVKHAWSHEDGRYELQVEAVPLDTPYRLPRLTPRPVAAGVHSAIVTGASGSEIHPDEHGRVFVRFPWDREGPADHGSSLPVRTMQPNTPGSMLLPRVGWEVWVMFEDGDPDRPYVIGRSYNAKQPPPVSLPKNKTMTSLATYSSPGGKAQNAITFDDAAGREHLAITAGAAMTTSVASNAHVQTAKVDNESVAGSLSRSVGGSEDVSVGQAYVVSCASQTASVGGSQTIRTSGSMMNGVGSETVIIGGSLLEQVGSPAAGAAALAKAAALHGAGSMGKVGAALAAGGGLAMGAVDGYKHGGAKGAGEAVGMGALGMVASHVPGGEAVLASVQNAAAPAPWHEGHETPGAQQAGGGAGGAASDASAASGGGAGHRDQVVNGALTEVIGGAHGLVTPGSVGWKTTGVATLLVGGSHTTQTADAGHKTDGVSTEVLGSLQIASGSTIARVISGALNASVGGAFSSSSGGAFNLKVDGALSFKVGGSLNLTGGVVTFVCGGSKVSASGGGVLIEAGTITITDTSKQSSKADHL